MPSELYNEAIYAPVRRTFADVRYALVAPEAKDTAEIVEIPIGNEFSRHDQIMDNVTNISAPIATFEPNHWRLDGTFVLPLPPEQSNMQVGLWNDVMSGDNSLFDTPKRIRIDFPQVQNIREFGVAFDEPSNNFITDLEFIAYDSYGGILYQERITDNNSAYAHSDGGATGVKSIDFIFYRTNNPSRLLRISELEFGKIIRFGVEDIFSLTLTTEASPTGNSFPIPQFTLRIMNGNRFNQFDPGSYANYLYSRQPFEYRHGIQLSTGGTEWIDMGTYYLGSWSMTDSDVNFTCGGSTSIIENYTYLDSTLLEFSIGGIIRRVLDTLGLAYYVPSLLDNSPVVTGWFGDRNYRVILTDLAELSCTLCYEDQRNVVQFTDILTAQQEVTEMNYGNMFNQPKSDLSAYYNGINLKEYTVNTTSGEIRFDSEEIFYEAPWRDPFEPDYPYKIDLPCMIRTPNFPAFRDWFLQRKFALLQKQLTCDINWRQNPDLKVGDAANVQLNWQGDRLNMSIVRQTISFNGGALSGSTKTVGENIASNSR